MLLRPFFGRMLVLGAGIALGSLFLPSTPPFGAVADGECEAFSGYSRGNDPSQSVVMHLCRSGEDVWGLKNSYGVAGSSSYRLSGEIKDDGLLWMTISHVVADQPSDGWVSCTDDVFQFRWSDTEEALVGRYDSAECDDHADMRVQQHQMLSDPIVLEDEDDTETVPASWRCGNH